MEAGRLLAGILLVITGVVHIIMYSKAPDDPGMIGMLDFGIIYGLTGLLLFTQKKYPVYLGLIFPLIGFALALIKFGFPVLISMMTVLYLIDVIVIICCALLILSRKEASEIKN